MAGIYIHIPFCKQTCYYCDFHFSTNQSQRGALVKALSKELCLQHQYLQGESISSIYFGGGTPSLLNTNELTLLIGTIKQQFDVDENAEITLEANPDDIKLPQLHAWKDLGINRLSIGIQSFQSKILQQLNRAHDGSQAISSLELARKAGFDNISLDLMYGIPSQLNEDFGDDIDQALFFQPEHLSAYSLTIEERTVFGNWAKKGRLIPVEDDRVACQMELLVEKLAHAGYVHYEVSNFALPSRQAVHNSNYWLGRPYLGIGPSAHSFDGSSRQYNAANNSIYMSSLEDGRVPFEREMLTRRQQINEHFLTRLRTSYGCDLVYLKENLGYDLLTTKGHFINQLIRQGLATHQNDILQLTEKGLTIADSITSEFFLSEDDKLTG